VIVGRSSFKLVLAQLLVEKKLSLDTETSGLRPYHGDRLFSLILSTAHEPYYFNFQPYPGLEPEFVLSLIHLRDLKALFNDPDRLWYMHNAKYDLAILAQDGIEVAGEIHCTQALARVEYNDHMSYALDACAERIGFKKDDSVENYIVENKLWTWTPEEKPGDREKMKHFDRVPFELISAYAKQDARITFALGEHQEKRFHDISEETAHAPALPTVQSIARNEKRLTKTVSRMEKVGVKIDRAYCVRASRYESDRADGSRAEFKKLTGCEFSASPKLFATIFADEKESWTFTEKGNPSFDSDALAKFQHPAAKAILDYRDAKSKSDFYRGFLWHADRHDIIHPNFNPGGAATGRFSSSSPNFQNLTSEEGQEDQEFVVRRAIIPRPGFVFYGRDYKQMEYVMASDYAAKVWGSETEMIRRLRRGEDVHQATADIVTAGGTPLTRKRAKNANFAFLFGSGYDTLAATCGCSRDEAIALKDAIRAACPEVQNLVNVVSATAKRNGHIFNWAGRRSYLKDTNFAYKMTNYLIQGGCADVNKIFLNRLDEYLLGKKSRLIMTIHDEAVIEWDQSEGEVPARMKEIMDGVYAGTYLNMTSSGYIGKSLADIEDHE
jgi:DNA polymerase I